MATEADEWKCSGCGAASPDRMRSCACPTACLYRETEGGLKHTVKKSAYSYDSRCLDLAKHFLSEGDEDDLADLAQTIQDAVEDWLGDRESENEAAYERQQQALMESGGPDDSAYRRDMIAAGRGHLLR